jgi:phytoene dehydrogenase-like protein
MGWPRPSSWRGRDCRSTCLRRKPTPGGAARTMELTLPGFSHDFGSAVHPLAAGSPFFSSLPLQDHGLQWIHSPAAARPSARRRHGRCTWSAILKDAKASLGADGNAWEQPGAAVCRELAPVRSRRASPTCPPFRHHPWLMARFGANALFSAKTIARRFRQRAHARVCSQGLAAHSFLGLDEPLSGAFGNDDRECPRTSAGWPVPRGGVAVPSPTRSAVIWRRSRNPR